MKRLVIENPQECPFGIAPQAGREYAVIMAACPDCEAKWRTQEGHSRCWAETVPEGWRDESGAILAQSGWVRLISRDIVIA